MLTDGTYDVTISAVDDGGNALSTPIGAIVLDRSPAQVVDSLIMPGPLLRPGRFAVVLVDLDDDVVGIPQLIGRTEDEPPRLLTFELDTPAGNAVSFRRIRNYDAPQGDFAHSLEDVVDRAGNASSPLSVGMLTVDATLELVRAESVVTPAPLGGTLMFALELDSATLGVPVVTLGTTSLVVIEDTSENPVRTCSANGTIRWTSRRLRPLLPVAASHLATDVAGNEASLDADDVFVDTVAPDLTDVYASPALAGVGTLVLLSVTVDERIQGVPQLHFDEVPSAADSDAFVFREVSGNAFLYELIVTDASPAGRFSLFQILNRG